MIYIIYGIILLGFWIRAVRIFPENYPHVHEDDLNIWKKELISSYKIYAIFYFIMIIFALIVSYFQNVITRASEKTIFANSPTYFKIIIYAELIYCLFCLVFIVRKAIKNHKLGYQVGAYYK
jgi:hypothetical protein